MHAEGSLGGCLLLFVGLPAEADSLLADQTRQVPESRQEIQLSFAPLVERTAPAVVNIYTRKIVRV